MTTPRHISHCISRQQKFIQASYFKFNKQPQCLISHSIFPIFKKESNPNLRFSLVFAEVILTVSATIKNRVVIGLMSQDFLFGFILERYISNSNLPGAIQLYSKKKKEARRCSRQNLVYHTDHTQFLTTDKRVESTSTKTENKFQAVYP